MSSATSELGAAVTLHATLAAARTDPPVELPAIAPERIEDFQREWRRRPGLRTLIRVAGRLDEAEVARSPSVRGLWELAHSAAWRDDARGLFCDFPEFGVLFEGRS